MIFRIAWVYAAHGHNFFRTMLRLAAEREVLHVVDDQHGAPTPAHWVAGATAHIIARGYDRSGTWHLAPQGRTTWHGFAERIFRVASRTGQIVRAPELIAVPTTAFPSAARRPSWSLLDSSRVYKDFGTKLPDWEAGLAPVFAEMHRIDLQPCS